MSLLTSAATFQTDFKKAALPLFSVAVLLAGGTTAVRGQSALDGFDPHANGNVQVIVVQPDGKILIGGSFTSLAPNGGVSVTRNRIARLNPDGTLDTAFNPNANDQVTSIAVQADGKILVGGVFSSIGGVTRTNIARLDATTGLADSFNPSANNQVTAIVVQADGKILVGGTFTSIGGQTRNRIARLDATGAVDLTFNPNANANIFAIALQADGKILVGGIFTGANSIGGQTRSCIARLDATTGLADSFNPNASDNVGSIVVQADGKVLVGGFFTSIGGQTRNRIARLNPNGTLDTAFNPSANDLVFSLALQADGKILVGGAFTTLAPNGGTAVTRNNIARLQTDGHLDQTVDFSIVGLQVRATAVQPDGAILIGGPFSSVSTQTRSNIARLYPDGRIFDSIFNPSANDVVYSVAVQADGKVLASGFFTSIGGATRNRIARLDATTGLADLFNPNPNQEVDSIALQADGKLLVGGNFTTIGGATRNRIARLDPPFGLADSFNPNANGPVYAIAVQPDGKILVGGLFTSIGGAARNRIARLDPTTGLADSFDPNCSGIVYSIVVQADGKILAGGSFSGTNSIGGQTRNVIARLDGTTGSADSFNPNANNVVYSIALQADSKILVGGNFNGANSIGGQTRNFIARLDPTTGLADSFNPNASNSVFSITLQTDGKVLAGGAFNNIGGQTRNLFARLSNDTAALQNLAASQTTVTWTLGGSSPQFTRVTFESSSDNVNYTLLGNGTPQSGSSNWTLTGLNLPTGTNIYIRARGSYRSGYLSSSESLTESVRNAFIVAQPLLNVQLSGNTNVVLTWATNFTGFTLEANTDLTTNAWSVVSPAPAVSGTNNVVTNATTAAQKFYRLSKP